MRGTRPRAICFDLDDTLLDGGRFLPTVDATCHELARHLGDVTAEQLQRANGQAFSDTWRELDEPWTLGKVETPVIMRETWRRALLACGYDDDALVTFAYETHAPLAATAHTLFDDARALLGAIEVPLALITNGASDLQREKLRAVGIEERFDVVVVSGEHGVAKPDGAIFAYALSTLGTGAGDTWHIGDNLHADVGGANAAGLTSVWINRTGKPRHASDPEPHHEVASLAELAMLLG